MRKFIDACLTYALNICFLLWCKSLLISMSARMDENSLPMICVAVMAFAGLIGLYHSTMWVTESLEEMKEGKDD